MTNNKPSASREFAFKFFYHLFLKENKALLENLSAGESADSLSDEITSFQESYLTPDKEHPESELNLGDLSAGEALIKGALGDYKEVEEKINAHLSKGRTIGKLEEMDRAILMIGTYEILKTDAPFKHVINDFVELSKKYSSEKSPSFINGILDAIAKS